MILPKTNNINRKHINNSLLALKIFKLIPTILTFQEVYVRKCTDMKLLSHLLKKVNITTRYMVVMILLTLPAVFSSNTASATHAAGAEIIYVHVADSTYQFFFKFYWDCTGQAQEPPQATLCIFNTCTNVSTNVNMPKWTGTLPPDNRPNGSPVSAGCSNYTNKCDNLGSTVPGYREWWYSVIINDLPFRCDYWKFAAWVVNRNQSINIGGGNLYVETIFNSDVNINQAWAASRNPSLYANGRTNWQNSSPFYSVKPIPYVCLNQPYSFNNGALDADGDSLFSIMVNPLQGGSCGATTTNVGLNTNLTPPINFTTNPFPTGNTFNLNGNNGQMNFTATLPGAATISMKTSEYVYNTNNVATEIGSIMRDVQVQVMACSAITPKLDTIKIGTGGDVLNGVVYGCINEKLDFCFDVTSTDPDAVLLAEDNLNTSIPGAKINYSNQATKTVTGCFSWTPSANDIGAHSFILVIKDSTCKPPGILLQYAKTVDLYVWGPVEASPDTNICVGESAFLGVSGGQNYQWTVISGTDPSLSNPNLSNPVATPKVTTVYKVESTINPYCPDFNKDTVKITVLKGPDILGQVDDTTCPGHPIDLDVRIVKDPNSNVTYTTTWTPTTGLSNPSVENPTAKLKTDQEYYIKIGSSDNRCFSFDTAYIDVLKGFDILNNDTAICMGQKVTIEGDGDDRYQYEWESPDPSASISSQNTIGTDITPANIGVGRYTLHARYPDKCPKVDSFLTIDIDLQPNPIVKVNEDETMCFGDTMQLKAIVTPNSYDKYSYDWAPGAALNFPDKPNPIYSAVTEGIDDIILNVTTPAGCNGKDTVTLTVFSPEFLFVPGDTGICPGDSIALHLTVAEGIKYYWAPDYNISSVNSQQPKVWPVTNMTYRVYGVDTLGCLDTADVNINVYARAVVEMPDSVVLYPGEKYTMDPGGNCLYYTWFPLVGLSNADVSNPSVSPKVNTKYTVQARTESGCSVTKDLEVFVRNDNQLDVPNAFTPGKRTNNMLKIVKRGVAELKSYSIYNRWGQKVFETTDINQGWDGTFKGELQSTGVYIYTIHGIGASGQTITKQGNVTLIR